MSQSFLDKMWDAIEDQDAVRFKRLLKSPKFKKDFLEDTMDDETMLYRATYIEDFDLVKALVMAGADVNALCGEYQKTPLLCALQEGREDIAIYLYKHGADPYMKGEDEDQTIYDYAVDYGHDDFFSVVDKEENRKRTEDPQKIIFDKDYIDYKAQEIYDFDDLVRIIVLMDGKKSPISFQRDIFKNIQDETGLQKAFNEHAKRGGKVLEQTIFPDRMVKSNPQQVHIKRRKNV